MSSWEAALPSGLGEAFPGDGAGTGVNVKFIGEDKPLLCLFLFGWIFVTSTRAVPEPGLWIRDICPPGVPTISPLHPQPASCLPQQSPSPNHF